MKIPIGVLIGLAVMGIALGHAAPGKTAQDTRLREDASARQAPEAHVALARAAAGDAYQNLFNFLCAVPTARGGGPRGGGAARGGPPSPGATADKPAADRPAWYAEPVKVFDNLYFVGQSEYSAWAVTTSEGIILIDTLFDYSVEEEVAGGLRKLGLDPATIRYAVVTHPHPDHHGGAKFLQDRYGTRVVMSAADWDVIDRLSGTKPARASATSVVATDGQSLTLGDTTITLYVTPGHTPGTLSLVMPVRDSVGRAGSAGGGATHTVAYWGGNGLNADRESLQAYVQSAQRFADIARQAGADILMSNHTDWDGAKVYLPQLATRAPGSAHPYVVGAQGVRRYLEVARECATSRLMRLN
jgi:metallo-beta-lactamase class B